MLLGSAEVGNILRAVISGDGTLPRFGVDAKALVQTTQDESDGTRLWRTGLRSTWHMASTHVDATNASRYAEERFGAFPRELSACRLNLDTLEMLMILAGYPYVFPGCCLQLDCCCLLYLRM